MENEDTLSWDSSTGPVLAPNIPEVQIRTSSAEDAGLIPNTQYNGTAPVSASVYIPEYTVPEGIFSGFMDTAIGTMLQEHETPTFDSDPYYNSEVDIQNIEQNYGSRLGDDDREFLLRAQSSGEFFYKQFQLQEKAERDAAAAQHPLAYMTGALVDVDTAVGFGVGKAAKVLNLSRKGAVGLNMAGVGAVSAGAYGSAVGTIPITAQQAAENAIYGAAASIFMGIPNAPKPRKAAQKPTGGAIPEGTPSVAPTAPTGAPVTSSRISAEDVFIQQMNPSGTIDTADDGASKLVKGDLVDPSPSAVPVRSLDSGISIVKEQGNFYARQDGVTIGQVELLDGETNIVVLPEAQGKGVGKALAMEFIKEHGVPPAGSFTPSGEAAFRSAWRALNKD